MRRARRGFDEIAAFDTERKRYKDLRARELCPLTKIHFLTEERLDSYEIRAVTLSSKSVGPDIGVPSLLTLPD